VLADDPLAILSDFRESCLLTGKRVALDTMAGKVRGDCLGVDGDGALRIETPSGEQRFFAGVVSEF
jgi:BirA family biotin operon repressor/biotin-[acetyl-CoA-carboxylase] ligase